MAGSIVTSSYDEGKVRGIQIAWTADSAGHVSGESVSGLWGKFLCVRFTSNENSGYTPNSGYSVFLHDADSCDLLGGVGTGLFPVSSGFGYQHKWKAPYSPNSYFPYLTNDTLTIQVDSCGQEKEGYVDIIFENK